MPTYIWECNFCQSQTEVVRPSKEYETPPDEGCSKCGDLDLQRIITRPTNCKGYILAMGGCGGFHVHDYSSAGKHVRSVS